MMWLNIRHVSPQKLRRAALEDLETKYRPINRSSFSVTSLSGGAWNKQVITALTVGRYGGEVLYRHAAGELWGGLRAVLGRFGQGFN